MKKIILKHFLSLFILSVLFVPSLQVLAADDLLKMVNDGGLNSIGRDAYGSTQPKDVRVVAANIIKKLLGFLGVILIGIILYAGFLWMTAGGESKKVEEAKGWVQNAVIGLIIIFSSYQLANFTLDCVIRVVGDKPASIWGGLCN